MLTHQKRVESGSAQTADIGGRVDPTLRNLSHAFRHLAGQVQGGIEKHLKSPQVAVIDADNARSGSNGGAQLVAVMHFHQRSHFISLGHFAKVAQFTLAENCSNQQDGVRAGSCCFYDLRAADGEVFTQDRQRHFRARRLEIGKAALKVRAIRQNRQRRRATRLVNTGNSPWIEIRLQEALARRRFLDLGNDGR